MLNIVSTSSIHLLIFILKIICYIIYYNLYTENETEIVGPRYLNLHINLNEFQLKVIVLDVVVDVQEPVFLLLLTLVSVKISFWFDSTFYK